MKLFTTEILASLTANAVATKLKQIEDGTEPDHVPVVKIFNPAGAATWLFTEIDEYGETLFGLCDMGLGMPELGYASRKEIESIRVPIRLGGLVLGAIGLERDLHFKPEYPLSVYAKAASIKTHITFDRAELESAARQLRSPKMSDWKKRAVSAAEGTRTGAIIACVLGHEIEPPCFHGKAAVTADGFIMCDFTSGDGLRHGGAMVGNLDDLEENVVQLARHLNLTATERGEFAAALGEWIKTEYCNARTRLKTALTTSYPVQQTPTLH